MNSQPPHLPVARLVSTAGDVYDFSRSSISLGRSDENDIVLNSRKASRRHALIFFSAGEFYVRDLESKNGTRLNGARLEGDRRLRHGDRLKIGELEFTFALPEQGDATETAETLSEASLIPTPAGEPLQLDFDAIQVRLNGKLLSPPLSPLEWKLLSLLYRQRGKACPRDLIFEELYNTPDLSDIPLDTALETLVSRLRKRLEMTGPDRLPYIRAIRGIGYRLDL